MSLVGSISGVNDYFDPWQGTFSVPGFPHHLLMAGPGPDLPVLGDQPLDKLAKKHNAVSAGATASVEEALALEQSAVEHERTREDALRAYATEGGNRPAAAKAPSLREQRDDAAAVGRARRDRAFELRQQWLDLMQQRGPSVVAKVDARIEKNRAAKDDALALLRAAVDTEADLEAHRTFIAAAMGSTYEMVDVGAPSGQVVHHPPNLSPQSAVVPQAVADALAAIDRAFHPITGNQGIEFQWNPDGDVAPPTDPRQMREAVS